MSERVYREVLHGRAPPEKACNAIMGRTCAVTALKSRVEMDSRAAPDGFAPHFKRSPVTDPWEPLFSRRLDKIVQLGLWVREAHCNSRGFLHGGVIATLADNAMGISCVAGHHAARSALTVSLSIDYVATAKIGQWLLIEPRVVRTGSTLGFVDALVTADGDTIARASATFRMLT